MPSVTKRSLELAPTATYCGLLLALLVAPSAMALPIPYGGRLVQADGAPREGKADLEVNFFDAAEHGAKLGSSPYSFAATVLTQGVFSIDIELSDADAAAIFKDPKAAVWIEVTDKTQGKVYPRQRFGIVPYALKVPVDGSTLGFDGSGQLTVLSTVGAGGVPDPLPEVDGAALTNVNASALRGSPIDAAAPAVGQVLKWNGSAWAPAADTDTDTDTTNPGTVTSITAGSGLTGGTITGSGSIGLAPVLPAIDGSGLTGVNAVKLQTIGVASTAPSVSQVIISY
jgi:hypothetical protein